MSKILTIIGGIVNGVVIWLTWYLSPDKIKQRAFENDEESRELFTGRLRIAKTYKEDGNKFDAKWYLNSARSMWLKKIRENRMK